MTSHQTNLFLTPGDLLECERRIRELGPVIFLDSYSTNGAPKLIQSSQIATMGCERLTIALARPEDLQYLQFRPVPGHSHFILDIIRSPAIELTRCFFSASTLRRGRLYFCSKAFSDNGILVEKDGKFLRWAQCIFKTTKAGLQFDRQLHSYVGAEADSLRNRSSLQFRV